MKNNQLLYGAFVLVIIAIIAFFLFSRHGMLPQQPPNQNNGQQQEKPVGLANPASTNCITIGGTLAIVDEQAGQVGYCHLPDGRVCEEWGLFRDGACTAPKPEK